MSISIVIPYYSANADTDAMLAECVASLSGYDELVIVTNQPTPDGEVLFSKYVNLGLRLAKGDFRIVVNSDTKLLSGNLADLCQPDAICSPVVNGAAQPLWGCFFCVPKGIYEQHGGLDEQYTGYWEDLDFAVGMYQKGVPLRSVASVQIGHIGGATYKRLNPGLMHETNRARFLAKWGRVWDVQELW